MTGAPAMTSHEIIERLKSLKTELLTCPFGIPYLDDALLGMSPGEVTLLGAKSGGGKTEAATQIVLEQQHPEKPRARRVLYIGLDHEQGEIETRVLWRMIAAQIIQTKDPRFHGVPLRYAAWRAGKYRNRVEDYESDAGIYYKHLFATSETEFHYKKMLTATEVSGLITGGVKGEFNLYVVDHFHAMRGLDSLEGQSEAITKLVAAAEEVERPILILGQFRKGISGQKNPLPAMEDFSGSSQLLYQPQNIVVMAPKHGGDANRYETYFHVVKSRRASDSKPFVGVHSFDTERKQYSGQYQISRYMPFGEPEQIETGGAIPKWAVHAVIGAPRAVPSPVGQRFFNDRYNPGNE